MNNNCQECLPDYIFKDNQCVKICDGTIKNLVLKEN